QQQQQPTPPPQPVFQELSPMAPLAQIPQYPASIPPGPMPLDEPAPSGWSKLAAFMGALSLVISVALAAFILYPRHGALKIELKTESGEAVARAEIYVDGQKRCDTVPCVVTGLEA